MKLDRRHFIARIGRTGLDLAAATSLLRFSSRVWGTEPVNAALKVCLLSGSKEYKSNESLAAFQELLERRYPVRCSRAFWTASDDLPGLEALDTCDVMLLFTKRLTISGQQLARVKNYCRAGRPIVGVRTASHAFQNWLELDREVFGGDYSGHYRSGPITRMEIANGASAHPILEGFQVFETPTKLYKNPKLAEDAHVLLNGSIPGHSEPLAWTREYRGGRIFYTSLGGPADFERDAFQSMLVNALFWTTRREPAT